MEDSEPAESTIRRIARSYILSGTDIRIDLAGLPGKDLENDVLVVAVKDLKVSKGSTGSHLFECDDGRAYLVKFKDGTRTAINEYVGYAVARMLGVAVPESSQVFVPGDLIEASDDLRMRGASPGIHFGSLWESNCIDFSGIPAQDLMDLPLTNKESLPGFIVFDNLVLNRDRNNAGNNLLQKKSTGYECRTVDFNEILAGPRWTIETMNLVKDTLELMPIHPLVRAAVNGPKSFTPWLESAEAITSGMVELMLSKVPDSWDIREGEKAAISGFILTRKTLVRSVLVSHKSAFANWR